MKHLLLLFAITLLTAHAKEPTDHSHLFAEEVESILAGLKDTAYQSRTVVDREKGVFRSNCSGLITYVLRHHFPEAYLSVRGRHAKWRTRPLAVTYYETFVSLDAEEHHKPSWQRVRKLMDAKPGDIIAWRKINLREGFNTGHICMIAGQPVQEADGRIRVRVVDSTSRPHANDTRPKGTRGLGAGEMWFAVNEVGEPVGYWSNEKSQRSKTNRIAIGRIVPVKNSIALHPREVRPEVLPVRIPDQDYLGLSLADALQLAAQRKIDSRVIGEDNLSKAVAKEIRSKRVNFILRKGKVIRTIRG